MGQHANIVHTSSTKCLIKLHLLFVQLSPLVNIQMAECTLLRVQRQKVCLSQKTPAKTLNIYRPLIKAFFFPRKHLTNSNKHTKNEVTGLSELHLTVPSGCYSEEQTTALGIKLSDFWSSASQSPNSLGKEVKHYLSGTQQSIPGGLRATQ